MHARLFSSLVVPASITLAFCGIVFGLWLLRMNQGLSLSNAALREKRAELLIQIKERNQEIALLKSRLETVSTATDSVSLKHKGRFVAGFYQQPTVSGLPVSFDNGTTGKKLVALTFDGSDHSNAAADILDTLKSRGIKATMFLSGMFIRKHPDVVRSILANGHEVGNHTFSHPHLTTYVQDHIQSTLPGVGEAFLCRELAKTDSEFYALTRSRLVPLWRAPYGEYNRMLCVWAQHAGYLHVGWRHGKTWRQSLDSNDWIPDEETSGYHSPQEVLEKIVSIANGSENGVSGGIILMHLGTVRPDKDRQVHRILGKLIDALSALGYRFVTVSGLLADSGVDVGVLNSARASIVHP